MNYNSEQRKIIVDMDEEITTVIDHLRHAQASNIALIVPQHAMILQSVVNLKLLAQEAMKLQKRIVIMTRDENGIAFAQRAGLDIQPFVAEEDEHIVQPIRTEIQKESVPQYANKILKENSKQIMRTDIGSQAFYARSRSTQKPLQEIQRGALLYEQQRKPETKNIIINSSNQVNGYVQKTNDNRVVDTRRNAVMRSDVSTIQKNRYPQSQMHNVQKNNYQNIREEHKDDFAEYEQSLLHARVIPVHEEKSSYKNNQTSSRVAPQNAFASEYAKNVDHKKTVNKKNSVPGNARILLKGFIVGSIILVIMIILIIVAPYTMVSVSPKQIVIDNDVEMTAYNNQSATDSDRRIIPSRLIERDVTFTKAFNATGSGDVDAQKSQGTITIYNEFSEATQPLVAQTRFLSENGVLFRLNHAVVVPGMKNGEPGKVEALVVADQSGSDANIGAMRFTVPGFEGSPKKNKFYAVSSEVMRGGGVSGQGVLIVTADDIANAKKQMEEELATYVNEQLKSLLRPESEILLQEAVIKEITRSEANVSADTMSEQFMYEIVTHVRAHVFSEDDVRSVLLSQIDKLLLQKRKESDTLNVAYKSVVMDQESSTIKLTVHVNAESIASVDLDAFKEDIKGKKHEEILSVIEDKYKENIDKITLEKILPGAPAFVANHISRFGFMTNMSLK